MTSSNRSAPTNSNAPLSQRTVVVTRPRAQADALVDALVHHGATVIEAPAFKVAALDNPDFPAAIESLSQSGSDTGLFFTSVNAVAYFAKACRDAGQNPDAIGRAFVGCVGPATRDALAAIGIEPNLMASVHSARGLVDAVADAREGATAALTRALFPCAQDASDTFEDGLSTLGIPVDSYAIYGAVPEVDAPPFQSIPDVVTFASPSAASMFEHIIDAETADHIKRESLAASIGPSTAKRVSELGYVRMLVASVHTVDGIVDALIEHFS